MLMSGFFWQVGLVSDYDLLALDSISGTVDIFLLPLLDILGDFSKFMCIISNFMRSFLVVGVLCFLFLCLTF